jgi:hypothetical protein
MLLTGEGDPAEGEAQVENIYIKKTDGQIQVMTHNSAKITLPKGNFLKG